jgi:hypothetical protein
MPVRQSKEARRETGGPYRRGNLTLGRSGADIETQYIALEALATADLRTE